VEISPYTIEEIEKALKEHDPKAWAVLDQAIVDEGIALVEMLNKPGQKKPVFINRAAIKKGCKDAKHFYACDITSFLVNPRPLSPEDILYTRRHPIAWAIAEVLRGKL
jgi:hypothetical protein